MKNLYAFLKIDKALWLELRGQISFAIPIFFSQVSMMLMGFLDVSMTGASSPTDMAAVALGGSFWLPVIFFCQGMLYALSPAVATLRGEGKASETRHVFRQGLWLAFFLSFLVVLTVCLIAFLLPKTSIDPELAKLSKGYLLAVVWGAPGFLFFIVARCYLEGMGLTRPAMFTGIFGLLVNFVCNYVFIFGMFFIPAFGGVGAGIATAIVYWFMFVTIYYYLYRMRRSDPSSRLEAEEKKGFDKSLIVKIVRAGFPGGVAMFIGVVSFAVVAVLIAPLGIIIVAGHQIAINFGALLYMFPSAISITASVRTGYAVGSSSYYMLKRVRFISIMLGITIGIVAGLLTFIFRYEIASIYNKNLEVLTLSTFLLIFVACYQCVDAIQVISSGLLRGYGDTTALLYIILGSYGFILPTGYILGRTDWFVDPMGVEGFWWSFVFALILAAILGLLRVRRLEHNFYNNLKLKGKI